MDLWLILTIGSAALIALYIFLDNYITDVFFKERLPESQKVFFGPAYLITAGLIALLFTIQPIAWQNAFWLIVAGVLVSLSLIPYYKALGSENATGVTILEQISPIFYLIFGRLLLGESISGWQLAAFVVILSAPMLTIFSTKKRSQKTEIKTAGFMAIKVIVMALANTMIVKFGCDCDFVTFLLFVTLGKGIGDTCLSLFNKKWRERFKNVAKKNNIKFYTILIIDHFTYLFADFSYYIALILAPTIAISSAINKAALPVLVFVMGLIFTILWPNFGREKMDKRTVRTHLLSTILAVVGIILMQLA